MKKYSVIILFLCAYCWAGVAAAEILTKSIDYRDGSTVLEGYLAYDNAIQQKTPAVVVIHDWMGVGPFIKEKAEALARLGYVAFAIDIYGKDIRPKNTQEASQKATLYRKNRALMRQRALAGIERLKRFALVDPEKIVVMGYCFGGSVALETARGGANIQGAVSVHGNLDTPNPNDAKKIKARILVLHGADDPHVKDTEVLRFQNEMRNARVDWQMIYYGNAVHSFTNPAAGDHTTKGSAYNESADERSWQALIDFLHECFR